MKRIFVPLSVLLLVGCSGSLNSTPPVQPTPESAQLVNARIAVISSDPVTTWQNNDYAVRAACYDYLNQQAQRSSDISLASSALGIGGGMAAVASGHPLVGAAAALGQTFLNLYQQSGAIPYTTETTMLIEAALDSVEAGVAVTPPRTTAQALLDIQKLWWQCSAGGYRMLVSQSVMAGARNVRTMPSITNVPRVYVEPQSMPVQIDAPEPMIELELAPTLHHSRHKTSNLDSYQARQEWLKSTSAYIPALDYKREKQ